MAFDYLLWATEALFGVVAAAFVVVADDAFVVVAADAVVADDASMGLSFR